MKMDNIWIHIVITVLVFSDKILQDSLLGDFHNLLCKSMIHYSNGENGQA